MNQSPVTGRAGVRPGTEPAVVPLAAQRWRRMEDVAFETPIVAIRYECPRPPAFGWRDFGWSLGRLLLLAGLLAQVSRYYRQDLVVIQRWHVLREVYGRLGPVVAELGPCGLRIGQSGDSDAVTEDLMMIRASLTNRAAFAVPDRNPRLELDDR